MKLCSFESRLVEVVDSLNVGHSRVLSGFSGSLSNTLVNHCIRPPIASLSQLVYMDAVTLGLQNGCAYRSQEWTLLDVLFEPICALK